MNFIQLNLRNEAEMSDDEKTISGPLVSVITIFLNGEKFIREAIESVLAQTYDNWELLLVDDGSTDNSAKIALEYTQRYPVKARYLEHEGHVNRGMSASRNLGVSHTRGEYIALLDADDVWLPRKLEQQVEILNALAEVGMVYGSTQTWFSWTGNREDADRDFKRKIGVEPNTVVRPPKLFVLCLGDHAKTPATCSVMIRRESVERIGGFEASFRGMYEDQAFFTKAFLEIPVFVSGQLWDRYRQHPDSCCNIAEMTGHYNPYQPNRAHHLFLNWLVNYLHQKKFETPEIWEAIDGALWPYRHPVRHRLARWFARPRLGIQRARDIIAPAQRKRP